MGYQVFLSSCVELGKKVFGWPAEGIEEKKVYMSSLVNNGIRGVSDVL